MQPYNSNDAVIAWKNYFILSERSDFGIIVKLSIAFYVFGMLTSFSGDETKVTLCRVMEYWKWVSNSLFMESLYIYIYMCVCVCVYACVCVIWYYILYYIIYYNMISSSSCRAAGTDIPWPSLTTPPYRSSLLAGLQGYIPYPHRAAVCMFDLVFLLLLGHMTATYIPLRKLSKLDEPDMI